MPCGGSRKTTHLDLEFDDGGAALSWKCVGVTTPVPEALVSLKDEGQGLKLSVENKEPLRAHLDRDHGSGPMLFFTHVTLKQR